MKDPYDLLEAISKVNNDNHAMKDLLWICFAAPLGVALCLFFWLWSFLPGRERRTLQELCASYVREVLL